MKKYVLEDGFEFLTNDADLVIKTRIPNHTAYQREDKSGVYVRGSIPTDKTSGLVDRTNISIPARIGEHLIIDNEFVGISASPTRINHIESKSGLLKKIAEFFSDGKR